MGRYGVAADVAGAAGAPHGAGNGTMHDQHR
jgi:hypothetical protein